MGRNHPVPSANGTRGRGRGGYAPRRGPRKAPNHEGRQQDGGLTQQNGGQTPDMMDVDSTARSDESTAQTTAEPAFSDMPRFDTLRGKIDNKILDTITQDMKFERMTPIQNATIEPLLSGKDVLGQARTGTGKTVAFLVPAIETLLTSNNNLISALIISPTRELVMQIAAEAEKLLSRFPKLTVQTAIGGTNKVTEGNRIFRGCSILVATPGRLLDHLQEEQLRYQLSTVNTLVLDEADRMLDMGFLPDIKRIIGYLPQPQQVSRQSMLFSATVPDSILTVAKTILKPSYFRISTIPEGESNMHERVPQYLVTVPTMIDLAPALLSILTHELTSTKDFKAIVFAPTAVLSDYYAHILETQVKQSKTLTINVSVMHSRMSQSKRISVTNEFRIARNAICIATDVIARGMDFPQVTHVIQVGLPMNRESYVHRLGRTARAEADGKGLLLLAQPEKSFLRELRDIKFLEYPHAISTAADALPANSLVDMEEEKKGKIYQGWLGYYKAMTKYTGWSSETLVAQANTFALEGLGCPEVPTLEKSTVGKMGLKGVRGLVIGPGSAGHSGGRRGGGGRGGGISRGGGRGGRGGAASGGQSSALGGRSGGNVGGPAW